MNDEEIKKMARMMSEKIAKGMLIDQLQADLAPLCNGGTVEIHDANVIEQGICINMSMFIPLPKEGEDG